MKYILVTFLILCIFTCTAYPRTLSKDDNCTYKVLKPYEYDPERIYPSNWTMPNIYYYVDNEIPEEPINEAMQQIKEKTCIRFNKIDNQSLNMEMEGLRFTSGRICGTTLGRINKTSLHNIYIGENCKNIAPRIQRLIATALGLINQHNRPDRDNYISVNLTDLPNARKSLVCNHSFIFDTNSVKTYGIGYDYNSLMHWKSDFCRHDGKSTFNATIPQYNDMMGQEKGLSFADYKLLNTHFCTYLNQKATYRNCSNDGYYLYGDKGKCVCSNGYKGSSCKALVKNSKDCNNKTQNISLSNGNLYLTENGIKNCTYMITASDDKRIKIKIKSVNTTHLEGGQKCAPEMGFEIKYRNDSSPAGLCLCGNHSSITLKSEGQRVLVLYRGRRNKDKFSLELKEVENKDKKKKIKKMI